MTESNRRNEFSTYVAHGLEWGTYEEWIERMGWAAERQAWIDAAVPATLARRAACPSMTNNERQAGLN